MGFENGVLIFNTPFFYLKIKLMKYFIVFLLCFCGVCRISYAQELGMSEGWLAVGHYKPYVLGGYKSTIDLPSFFLSKNGQENPQKELNATIALFNSVEEKDNAQKCLMPSRYKFLQKNNVKIEKFPKCEEYEKFIEDLKPSGVTLLFTNAYMNNPSSLYGHTMFRIDTSRKGTQMLAHGATHGAFAVDSNGFLYALKGVWGGYYGSYMVKPYYDIINTYNNIENRDIWEYNLDLSQEELDFFVAHLWEMGNTQTRYYFFTRNCSYMLMETLDAVRPSLKLSDEFPLQAIPVDTLKKVASRKGLIKSTKYRPSRQAKINYRISQMNENQYKVFLDTVKNQNWDYDGLPDNEKADVLETAYQYIQYQYVAEELDLKEYRQRSFRALTARNQVNTEKYFKELSEGRNPLDSHESKRLVTGVGVRNGQSFQELALRPAYNSLTDDSYGLLSGSEINFLNVSARHYDNDDKYVLQSFDLVGIKSFFPVNDLFSPVSYNIQATINREMNPQNEDEGYVFNLLVGGGLSHKITDGVLAYAMVNNYLAYGGFLPHNQWVGMGFAGGIYADLGKFRFLGEVEKVVATSHYGDKMKYSAEAVYSLNRNNALSLNYVYHQNYGKDVEESILSLRHYF